MTKKIAVFYGGKITQHLVLIREAAKKLGVKLDLISYNQVVMETEKNEIWIRSPRIEDATKININEYEVVFFRTTGKHWEEVDLILSNLRKEVVVVDPLVEKGKPSQACKAWQMKKLSEAGIPVPKTIYGSLWFLYEYMVRQQFFVDAHTLDDSPAALQKKLIDSPINFPIILKGSGGDRGTRVFMAKNIKEMEKLVHDLRKSDYRVLILGEKVLGVMKRYRTKKGEFRNNFSMGGEVEVADLPENVKKMAVEAAKVCGLAVAGVDVMPRNNYKLRITNYELNNNKQIKLSNDINDYVILEVNKGPQFKGFMKATGIDVPSEIVKYLIGLNPTD
jgi:glutathione synthase/RimK-type ligase-like ATP-grasp enzyme